MKSKRRIDGYFNSKGYKKWEKDFKEKKAGFVCDCCGDCGGLITYSKEFKVWSCKKCGGVTTKQHIKQLTRVF